MTMTSQDALTAAIEQVNKLSTNSRGFQDGITLPQKIDAVERLAAVLMGEDTVEGVGLVEGVEGLGLVVEFGNYWPNEDVLFSCKLCGAITEETGPHTDWHRGLGR